MKIHLDDGYGNVVNWEPADLTETIGRADEAGWQVSVHAMSSVAMGMVLDAYESALGPTGPNPLHHRVEHALQVTDEQLARLVAMDIPVVIQLDGAADWLLDKDVLAAFDRDRPGKENRLAHALARLRRRRPARRLGDRRAVDLSGELELTDDIGRPVDQIASGMDGRVRTELGCRRRGCATSG